MKTKKNADEQAVNKRLRKKVMTLKLLLGDRKVVIGHEETPPLQFVIRKDEQVDWEDLGEWKPMIRALDEEV